MNVWQRQWWKQLERVGKRQSKRNRKLITDLLPKPAPKKRASSARKTGIKIGTNAGIKSVIKPALKRAPKLTQPSAAFKLKPSRTHSTKLIPVQRKATGKWLSGYFISTELDRKLFTQRMLYWLYLPSTLATTTPAASLPLVVMLHGCEQSATEFARGTRMNFLAEEKGFAVLYPQQARVVHPNRCWHWYVTEEQHGGAETLLIAGAIQKVLHTHGLDRSRVYLAGISAGAAIATEVALNYPRMVAALGLHSAPVFGAATSMMNAYSIMQHGAAGRLTQPIRAALARQPQFPTLPAILIQGLQDKVVRPINQQQLVTQFLELRNQQNPLPPTLDKTETRVLGRGSSAYTREDYSDNGRVFLRVCQVEQLEHAWSGGDRQLPFNGAGPDASKMMWSFFSRQRRVLPDID